MPLYPDIAKKIRAVRDLAYTPASTVKSLAHTSLSHIANCFEWGALMNPAPPLAQPPVTAAEWKIYNEFMAKLGDANLRMGAEFQPMMENLRKGSTGPISNRAPAMDYFLENRKKGVAILLARISYDLTTMRTQVGYIEGCEEALDAAAALVKGTNMEIVLRELRKHIALIGTLPL